MDDSWQLGLEVRSLGGRCRLSLGGHAYGEGDTLQEAADDLVVRLFARRVHPATRLRSASARGVKRAKRSRACVTPLGWCDKVARGPSLWGFRKRM